MNIQKIRQIIRCFETGKVTGADYGAMVVFKDGPGKRRQITYGASQTTEYGNLKELIRMYVEANGQLSATLKGFLPGIGDLNQPTMADNIGFVQALKDASRDPVMQATQDKFFEKYYFAPAMEWFTRHGFTLPLSLLVIYDSYVHSGSILKFLRDKFPAKVPADGGDEKLWISSYVTVRDEWLETHANKILRNTDYRTDSFTNAMRQDNWDLDQPFLVGDYATTEETGKFTVRAKIV